jgi:hypothetical protein
MGVIANVMTVSTVLMTPALIPLLVLPLFCCHLSPNDLQMSLENDNFEK